MTDTGCKVSAGNRLWPLLPGAKNPPPLLKSVGLLEKKNFFFFYIKFLNPVFPSPNDILKEEQ